MVNRARGNRAILSLLSLYVDESDCKNLFIERPYRPDHMYSVGHDIWITELKVSNESLNFILETRAKCCIDTFFNVRLEKSSKQAMTYNQNTSNREVYHKLFFSSNFIADTMNWFLNFNVGLKSCYQKFTMPL